MKVSRASDPPFTKGQEAIVVLDDRIIELEKKLAEHIAYSNAMKQDREAALQHADEADMEVGRLKAQRDKLQKGLEQLVGFKTKGIFLEKNPKE